jgi:hypothetical protein
MHSKLPICYLQNLEATRFYRIQLILRPYPPTFCERASKFARYRFAYTLYTCSECLKSKPRTPCRFWRLRYLPTYKSNWLLGNMLDVFKPNHHLFLREAANAVGGIFKMRILWLQVALSTPSPPPPHPAPLSAHNHTLAFN